MPCCTGRAQRPRITHSCARSMAILHFLFSHFSLHTQKYCIFFAASSTILTISRGVVSVVYLSPTHHATATLFVANPNASTFMIWPRQFGARGDELLWIFFATRRGFVHTSTHRAHVPSARRSRSLAPGCTQSRHSS